MRPLVLLVSGLLLTAAEITMPPVPPALSVTRLAVAPLLTAVADDPAWATATRIEQLGPCRAWEGVDVPGPVTSVLLGWMPEALYIRFVCTDAEIHAPIHGRDADLYKGDAVEVFLDAVGDAHTTMELQVNPAGDLLDQMNALVEAPRAQPGNGLLPWDQVGSSWFGVRTWTCEGLRHAAAHTTDGWIVDVAIPAKPALARLRREVFAPMDLRLNLVRCDYPPHADGTDRTLVMSAWSMTMAGCPHASPSRIGFIRLAE